MKKWKSISAILLCMLLLAATACKSGTSDKKPGGATATPGASEAPVKGSVLKKYPMLKNLDLDGTLKPGMYKGKKIVVATSAGDYEKSMKVYKQLFHELTGGEVEIQSFPDQLFEKAQMALNTGGQFDVIVMPIAYIQHFR